MQYRKRLIVASALLAGAAQAQVTLDGTLGRAGALSGPNYQITPDLGRQVGGNLFHSFGQFSMNTGESATFSGPHSVSNIIGRVTGGQMSFIDGTIRSTIPGANLYLLNPAGMLFGENARLDVNGAFHASTADYVRLDDGGRFDARTPANSLLTVAPVAAFGFLGESPAPITLTGSFLQVPEGQTLSLIGGDISLSNATLYAPAGRINLASVGSAGEVVPSDTDLAMQGFDTLGTFTLEHTSTQRPTLNLGETWGEVPLANLDASGSGGGVIFIRGGQWISQGGWVFANTYDNKAGHGVDVAVTGEVRLEGKTGLSAATYGTGDAGSITLNVGSLALREGSQLSTSTFSMGHGGNLTLTVRDAMVLTGDSHLYATAQPQSTGNAGSITLNTDQLDLSGGSQIFSGTFSVGDGGGITLNARDTVTISGIDPTGRYPSGLFANAQPGAAGAAGSITLDVGRLELREGGLVSSTTWGAGHGGDIILNARDPVTISGIDPTGRYPSGLYTQVQPGATGNAGSIILNVGHLELREGGLISSATLGVGHGGDITLNARDTVTISGIDPTGRYPSSLFAGAYAGSTGNAGSITLDVGRLELRRGGLIASATLGAGRGGDIALIARDAVTISGIDPTGHYSSGLFASAEPGSTGDTGDSDSNITLTTPSLTLADGGIVSTTSATTSGGNITLNATYLKLFNGGAVSASVYGDTDTEGGNVTINSTNLVALNGSKITAQATQGRGGNIQVNADVFLHDAANVNDVLNASSQVIGNDGTVAINAPNAESISSLTVLPTRYLNAADQIGHRCGASDPDTRSRLTVQGRGGLPPDPDQPATTRATGCSSESPTLTNTASLTVAPITQSSSTTANFGDY